MYDMSDAEVLRAARKVIEFGWCQGSYWEDDGSCCAVGALFRTLGEEHVSDRNRQAVRCLQAMTVAIGDDPDGTILDGRITIWNDQESRTRQEVLDMLDRAVSVLERGAIPPVTTPS